MLKDKIIKQSIKINCQWKKIKGMKIKFEGKQN